MTNTRTHTHMHNTHALHMYIIYQLLYLHMYVSYLYCSVFSLTLTHIHSEDHSMFVDESVGFIDAGKCIHMRN